MYDESADKTTAPACGPLCGRMRRRIGAPAGRPNGHPPGLVEAFRFKNGGQGVGKDPAKAAEWFEKAAAKGVSFAEWSLAWMYFKCEGVKEAKERAIALMKKRADATPDSPKAQDALKIMRGTRWRIYRRDGSVEEEAEAPPATAEGIRKVDVDPEIRGVSEGGKGPIRQAPEAADLAPPRPYGGRRDRKAGEA